MLRAMPGVNSKNYRYLMRKVASVQELVELDEKDMEDLVGSENARVLRAFVEENAGLAH